MFPVSPHSVLQNCCPKRKPPVLSHKHAYAHTHTHIHMKIFQVVAKVVISVTLRGWERRENNYFYLPVHAECPKKLGLDQVGDKRLDGAQPRTPTWIRCRHLNHHLLPPSVCTTRKLGPRAESRH